MAASTNDDLVGLTQNPLEIQLSEELLNDLLAPFDENINNPTGLNHELYDPNVLVPTILQETDIVNTENTRNEDCLDVEKFIDSQKKQSTKKATEKDVKNVQRWLWDVKKEPRLIENINPTCLNKYFAQMFISIRKPDGGEYEPTTLECIKNSIDRHLKSKGYQTSLRDRQFAKANEALTAKKMQLKKLGMGRKAKASDAISKEDEELMFKKGLLGCSTPDSLQFSVFYYFGKLFGLRGRDEQRKLKYGDIQLKMDSAGIEYLEYQERDSKTFDGSKKDDFRSTRPRIFSCSGEENDPVYLFKKFVERRPSDANLPSSPLYLIPKLKKYIQPGDQIWYYPRPMGANSLGKLVKEAASQCGIIHKRITNHSVRKTCVSTLSKAGVPPTKIMQVTGHKNVSSITAYDTCLSMDEQKTMSSILVGGEKQINNSASTSMPSLASAGISQAIVPSMSNQETTQNPFSIAEDINKNLFRGAYIGTINLNISMK